MDKLYTTANSSARTPPGDLRGEKDQIRRDWLFVAALLCISSAIHIFIALSLGAKYWWDTVAYFQLAEGLANPDALHELYNGSFGIIYQHVTPGLPFLILIFERLFASHMWQAFAILQNALDVFACVYLATSLSGYIGKGGQLATVILIALFPWFSAFHNAILTESLTSSLVMIVAGVTIRCLEHRMECLRGLTVILLLGILGAQFRGYIVVVSGGLSLLVVYGFYRRRIWLYLAIAASTSLSILAFPLYRATVGADFFVPNVDALMLMHAHYVNWMLDENSKQALQGVVVNQEIERKLETAESDITFDDVIEMVDSLVRTGLSRKEAINRISRAGWVLRTQSGDVIARQLQLSLSSLGFQWLSSCCERNRLLAFNNFTAERMLAHLKYYYLWNAGLDGTDYLAQFQNFEDRYRRSHWYSSTAIDWYASRVGPFVLPHPYAWRDFLRLSKIPADLLILTGLSGFLIMAQRDKRIFAMLIFMMGIVYTASLSAVVFGDNRYAHFLWPFYLAGNVALLNRIVRSRGLGLH